MKKPHNTHIKDYLVKRLAVSMNMSQDIIDKVISHQFESANAAVKKVNTIEISGFGKFVVLPVKTKKLLDKANSKIKFFTERLNKPGISEKEKESLTNKINNTLVQVSQYEAKLKRHEQNNRVSKTDTISNTECSRDSISSDE